MNDYIKQYTSTSEQHWRSMDLVSKCSAILICAILLFSGIITGLFIFGASLAVALAVYLNSLLSRNLKKGDLNNCAYSVD
jgi:hypothetical protein